MIFYKINYEGIRHDEYGFTESMEELALRLYSAKGAEPFNFLFTATDKFNIEILYTDTRNLSFADKFTIKELLEKASEYMASGKEETPKFMEGENNGVN